MCQSLACLLALLSIVSRLANASNLVPDTCQKISKANPNVKYNFCVTTLGSDPQSSTATLEQLRQISFQLGISKAKSIISYINSIQYDPKFDTFVVSAFADCSIYYFNASNDLQEGLEAVKEKDYNTAIAKARAALDAEGNCEGDFKLIKEISPWSQENTDFKNLAGISLVIPTIN